MAAINGRDIAGKIISDLKIRPIPGKKLAAIFVGESPASESFLRQKEKVAKELGIEFQIYQLPESMDQEDLEDKVERIGKSEKIGGMIIQLPLPDKFNRERILARINPAKDIDALTPGSPVEPLPVGVIKEIISSIIANEPGELAEYLKNKSVAVVGRGILVGKPIAEWLKGKCREIKVFFSGSDLSELKNYDLVMTGVGKAGLIKPEALKFGAGVIDFGFDMKGGKISGDLDTTRLTANNSRLSFYTPTPGGTGPILVAELFKNFYRLIS